MGVLGGIWIWSLTCRSVQAVVNDIVGVDGGLSAELAIDGRRINRSNGNSIRCVSDSDRYVDRGATVEGNRELFVMKRHFGLLRHRTYAGGGVAGGLDGGGS